LLILEAIHYLHNNYFLIDQYTSLWERFLRKGFWLYLFSFIIAPMGYIVKIIISGELTVSEVGILYGVISLIVLLSSFNDLWMTESLKHFIPQFVTEKRYDKVKSILCYSLIAQVVSSTIITFFFFFWADIIANSYFKTPEAVNIIKIFSLYFIWINIFQVIGSFFIAIQNTFLNKIIEFFRMGFVLISVLVIYFTDISNLQNYSFSWIIWLYMGVMVAIIFFYIKYYRKQMQNEQLLWSRTLFYQVFKYAIWVVLWAQAGMLLSQIDMQMIIYILGTQDAWYYTNYLSIVSIPFMLIWPIFTLLLPIFSEMYSKNEFEKIRKIKNMFQKNFLALWIAFNILFFVFAPTIAYILFWEKFVTSWDILRYSILFLSFNFLFQINFNILAWIWQIKKRVKIVSIALIFNFFTNLLLIKLIWVEGAALATGVGWILVWILSEYYIWKKYIMHLYYIFLTKNIILMWLLWIVIYYLWSPILEWASRWSSFWIMFIIGIIWFSFFACINIRECKNFLLEIRKISPNKS